MQDNQDDEQAYLKRWYKFAKIHKSIPPIKKDSHLESLSYYVKLTNVTNIPIRKEVQQSIRVLFNLYNSDAKEFFGRTYESPFLELKLDNQQQLEHQEVFAFFHLKNTENVTVVVEVVLFENKDKVIINRQILGWCQCNFGELNKYTLKRGSSRFLVSAQTFQDTVLQTIMVDIQEDKQFQKIKHLIPEGCLVGYGDEILGIKDYQLVVDVIPLKENIAFITEIQVLMPALVDLLITEYLKKYKQVKYKDDGPNEVYFLAKRLVIAFHNGWNYTNNRGLNNFITLEENSFQNLIDNQKVDFKKLTFKGALDINGIFIEPKIGVFVIQLEYDVEFMVTNLGKQRQTIICGWMPLIPKQKFEEELILGPGRTMNNQVLIDLSEIPYPIIISGNINYGGLPGGGQQQQFIVTPPQESLANIPNMFQDNMPQQIGIDEDQKKIKQLENAMKQLQQERQVSATNLAVDYENQLKKEKQKELEYQKMVETIKKQHELEIQKILEQYNELKKMMTDINETQQQYLTKAQPTTLSLQQSVLYDQKELEKWKIIESMTSVPRKTFYKTQQVDLLVQATFGGQALTHGDIAFLSQNGVRELFMQHSDYIENDEIKQKSIQYELQDNRQSVILQIQLLSFKPRITQDSRGLEPQFNYYSEESRIPTRIHLTVNYFDFPEYCTESLIYENGYGEQQYMKCLEQGTPFLLIREQFLKKGTSFKEPVFQFEVIPSQIQYPKAYPILCEYLFNKCIQIDIWDHDSMMLFGSVRFPLRQLLRQCQDAAIMMRKADIIDKDFKRIKGELQVLLKTVGKIDKITEMQDASGFKRKVISTVKVKPQVLMVSEEQDLVKQDPDQRILERISRIKNVELSSQTQKVQALQEINRFKEVKKNAFVRSVIQDHLSDEKIIYPFFGKVEIIELEFRNPYMNGQNFIIALDDQEIKCSQIQELFLIHQPVEWKYYVDTYDYQKPNDYNMIQKNATNFTIFLQGKEKIVLLLKYQTFREVSQFQEIQKTEELFLQKGKGFLEQYCYPRQVAIFINTIEGQSVGGMRIKIFPHQSAIDHIYRFYERDNRQISITFPALYGYTVPRPDKRPILQCNEKQIVVEWANDFEIRISLRMPEVNKIMIFNILAYQDTYLREMVANWIINIHSLAGIGIEIPLGQVQSSKLTVHVDISRTVKFFSSHPLSVWFPQPFDKPVNLLPGKINIASLCVRLFSEEILKVLITCVDEQSQELVRSWILNISPTIPPISQVFDVTAPRDQKKTFLVKYANKLNNEILLLFKSSNTQILTLTETKYLFKAQQQQDIIVQIKRLGELEKAEVKVFVGDEGRSKDVYDCLLFRITYV